MTLGKRIRDIRGAQSQEEFALKLTVHKNTLASYERDQRQPDSDFLVKLLLLHPEINPSWLLLGKMPAKLPTDTSMHVKEVSPDYLTGKDLTQDFLVEWLRQEFSGKSPAEIIDVLVDLREVIRKKSATGNK